MRSRGRQRGYILLTLLFTVTLFVIAAAVVAPSIAFQIKRDREEELIHRGAQYAGAIRLYAKKTGRFPLRIEELYDPNGQKYIRKLYKDPITGRDFKLLHTADIMMGTSPVDLNKSQPQSAESEAAVSPDSTAVAPAETARSAGNAANPKQPGSTPNGAAAGFGAASGTPLAPDDPTRGLIFGVASTSKKQSIREFNHKSHYNEWLFFYDLNHDTGHRITGPTPLTPPTMSLQGQSTASPTQSSGVPAPPAPSQQ
jgi:type II secretory pathway pseudopilin PulG